MSAPTTTAGAASDSPASTHDFQGVFTLIDHRGFGKVTLESIFEFVNAMPVPPASDAVMRIYAEFDEDGSGDIDAHEFVGLCSALESLLAMTAHDMIGHFERSQYQRLFQLCDEDNGGTIDSNELKAVIESLHGMLSLKGTAADVALIMRDTHMSELAFDDFYAIMKKICKGKPIQFVVKAFEEAQRRSKDLKSSALKRFQDAASGVREQSNVVKKVLDKERVCINCTKRELEIRELRSRLSELESQLSQSFSAAAQQEACSLISVEPRLQSASKSLESAVGIFKQFAPALQSAAFHCRSHRVRRITDTALETERDDHSRKLAEMADIVHKAQRQIGPVYTPVRSICHEIVTKKLDILRLILDAKQSGQVPPGVANTFQDAAAFCATKRIEVCAMSESLAWVTECAAEVRSTLSEATLAAASYSSAPKKLMQCVREAEITTERLFELFVLLSFYGSENLSEAEDLMNASAADVLRYDASVIEGLLHRCEAEAQTLSKKSFDALTAALRDTTYAFQSIASSVLKSTTKDRAVGTQPLEAILPAEPLRRLPPAKKYEDSSPMFAAQSAFSRPARARNIFAEQDRRAETVDNLVARYLASGIRVPRNFTRVRPADDRLAQVRNPFRFGTKIIELLVVEDYIAVIVGGGYMYLDEFCERYTSAEEVKLERGGGPSLPSSSSCVDAAKRSTSPSATRSMSPPAAGGPSAKQRGATAGSRGGSVEPNTTMSPNMFGGHGAKTLSRIQGSSQAVSSGQVRRSQGEAAGISSAGSPPFASTRSMSPS